MRILIYLHHQPKPGSYADNLLRAITVFFEQKGYKILAANTLSEASQLNNEGEQTLIVAKSSSRFTNIFTKLQVRNLITKKRIQQFILFTEKYDSFSPAPQLVVPTITDTFFIKQKFALKETIAVASDYILKKMVAELQVPKDQIQVIPAAAGAEYAPISWSEKQAVKLEYAQGREYFLIRGEHKTQADFVSFYKAFSSFKKWQRSGMKLIITDKLSFSKKEDWLQKQSTYKYRDDVVLAEALPQQKWVQLLAGAYVFIHSPTTDDDIMPLLQAMLCQTPCVSFATATIKEYAGEAAIVVEPNHYEQLTETITLLYKDETLRSKMVNACTVQSHIYSLKNQAEIITKVLAAGATGK